MTAIKNMGPKSSAWLHEIGIDTLEDLEAIGTVEAYRRLKASRPTVVTLIALWGMQAALLNIHWNMLTPEMKAELKAQIE